jgi:hypothetical protein
MHRLLISYRPPYYGMGSMLYQMLGAVPFGLARRGRLPSVPCLSAWAMASDDIRADCSWAVAAVPFSDVGGRSPAAGATAEEVILPLWGGVYGKLTPSGDCPDLCVGFQSGDLPSAIQWLATVCADPCWGGLDFFTARKGAVTLEYFVGCGLRLPRQKEVLRLWLCNNRQCVA